jgi:hypothetical protein
MFSSALRLIAVGHPLVDSRIHGVELKPFVQALRNRKRAIAENTSE